MIEFDAVSRTKPSQTYLTLVPGQCRASVMYLPGSGKFEARVAYLAKVREAFLRLKEFGFLALAGEDVSVEGNSGCRFSLAAEFRFLIGFPLIIECFSTNHQSTIWITRTLMSALANLGIQEVFDTYHGPELECSALRDDSETFVEIH